MFKFLNKKKHVNNDKIIITWAIITIVLFVFFTWYVANRNFSQEPPTKNDQPVSYENIENNNQDILEKIKDIKIEKVEAISGDDHYLGVLDAPVQIIVYSDLDDAFAAEYNDNLKKIKDEFGDNVVIAFRHFPLRMNHFSFDAALAVECADEDGKFWEMIDKIFEYKKNNQLDLDRIKEIPEEIGLNKGGFDKCFNSKKYEERIEKQEKTGNKCGVTGVPVTFINSNVYPGSYPMDDFVGSDDRHRRGLRNIIRGYVDSVNKTGTEN